MSTVWMATSVSKIRYFWKLKENIKERFLNEHLWRAVFYIGFLFILLYYGNFLVNFGVYIWSHVKKWFCFQVQVFTDCRNKHFHIPFRNLRIQILYEIKIHYSAGRTENATLCLIKLKQVLKRWQTPTIITSFSALKSVLCVSFSCVKYQYKYGGFFFYRST